MRVRGVAARTDRLWLHYYLLATIGSMSSSGDAVVVQGDQAQGEQGQAPAAGRTWWQLLRSVLFQMVVFYFIMNFFRGRQQQAPPVSPEGHHPSAGTNLFPTGQQTVGII